MPAYPRRQIDALMKLILGSSMFPKIDQVKKESYRVFRRVGVHPRVGRVLVEHQGITISRSRTSIKEPSV